MPYAVKVHGSALEYTVKPNPERFLTPAREGLAPARGVLVGSHHTAASLWAAIGEQDLPERTRLGPPGVDVARFAPRDPGGGRGRARAGSPRDCGRARSARRRREPASAFERDPREAAAAVARLDPGQGPLVAFVGKLIVSKGVDLLLAAWPLVLARLPQARLVVVGFGAYRDGFSRLAAALREGDLEAARRIALAGRTLEDDAAPPMPLRHLLAFLDSLEGAEREAYLTAARHARTSASC